MRALSAALPTGPHTSLPLPAQSGPPLPAWAVLLSRAGRVLRPSLVQCTLSCWVNPHHLCRLCEHQDRLQLSLTHSPGHWLWALGQTRLLQSLRGSQVPGSAVRPCQLGLPMQEVVPSGTGAHRVVSASCIFDVVGQPALVFVWLLSLAHSASGGFCGSSKHIT